jgi:hypothetical protein
MSMAILIYNTLNQPPQVITILLTHLNQQVWHYLGYMIYPLGFNHKNLVLEGWLTHCGN